MRAPIPVILCAAAFIVQLESQTGALHKVWEVDVAKKVDLQGRESSLPVFALRFSPDGRKLAVIMDRYGIGQETKSLLMLMDVERPNVPLQQSAVGFGVLENENGRLGGLLFGWSPSGQVVYATVTVIHVGNSKTCDLPNGRGGVFIRDDLAIARFFPRQAEATSHFRFYDSDCQEQNQWDIPNGWSIEDVSLDRHLLAVTSNLAPDPKYETWIVDPIERSVHRRFGQLEALSPQFADYGRAVCGGRNPLDADRAPAACWDVDTGAKIGETPKANGSFALSAATHAKRVVVSDYRRKKIPFSYEHTATFNGRVVWDFGTGREIASWHPESQSYLLPSKPPRRITEPFRFAISPDGNYIAEGGNGVIRLYKVEP